MGLANMFEIAIGNGIGFGFAYALDTLGSQAFGAKNYRFVEIYYQRSCAILILVGAFISVLFYYSSPILMLLGNDQNITLVS